MGPIQKPLCREFPREKVEVKWCREFLRKKVKWCREFLREKVKVRWWRSNGFSDERGGSFLSIVGRRALKLWWDHLSPDCTWMANAKFQNYFSKLFFITTELILTHIHRVLLKNSKYRNHNFFVIWTHYSPDRLWMSNAFAQHMQWTIVLNRLKCTL